MTLVEAQVQKPSLSPIKTMTKMDTFNALADHRVLQAVEPQTAKNFKESGNNWNKKLTISGPN